MANPLEAPRPPSEIATSNSSSRSSLFGDKIVHELSCTSCKRQVCHRAMKALLLADTKTELYSTDSAQGKGCIGVADLYTAKGCDCKIQDIACLGCGAVVGYHVMKPCENCMKACNNGHLRMFHGSEVQSIERATENNASYMRWSCIPHEIEDLESASKTFFGSFLECRSVTCIR